MEFGESRLNHYDMASVVACSLVFRDIWFWCSQRRQLSYDVVVLCVCVCVCVLFTSVCVHIYIHTHINYDS